MATMYLDPKGKQTAAQYTQGKQPVAATNPRVKRTNIIKPVFDFGGGGGILWGTPGNDPGPITIYDPDGNVVETLNRGSSGREGYKYPSQYISSGAKPGSYFEVGGARS